MNLTAQYAEAHAQTVVPNMLDAIAKVRRNSAWIARGALAVTTPHQVLFLGGLGHGGSTFDIVTAWCFAALIPAITDLGMLTMLRITQTAGMHTQARRRALLVLVLLVVESATVNAIAPGHLVFRVLVAFAAVVLALVEWVHAAVRPDFTALETVEAEAVAQATPEPVKTAGRKCETGCACGKHIRKAKVAKVPAQRKPRQTKTDRQYANAEAELLAMVRGDLPEAPVSPAPIGA